MGRGERNGGLDRGSPRSVEDIVTRSLCEGSGIGLKFGYVGTKDWNLMYGGKSSGLPYVKVLV